MNWADNVAGTGIQRQNFTPQDEKNAGNTENGFLGDPLYSAIPAQPSGISTGITLFTWRR